MNIYSQLEKCYRLSEHQSMARTHSRLDGLAEKWTRPVLEKGVWTEKCAHTLIGHEMWAFILVRSIIDWLHILRYPPPLSSTIQVQLRSTPPCEMRGPYSKLSRSTTTMIVLFQGTIVLRITYGPCACCMGSSADAEREYRRATAATRMR